jgi:hypothetical protein
LVLHCDGPSADNDGVRILRHDSCRDCLPELEIAIGVRLICVSSVSHHPVTYGKFAKLGIFLPTAGVSGNRKYW